MACDKFREYEMLWNIKFYTQRFFVICTSYSSISCIKYHENVCFGVNGFNSTEQLRDRQHYPVKDSLFLLQYGKSGQYIFRI